MTEDLFVNGCATGVPHLSRVTARAVVAAIERRQETTHEGKGRKYERRSSHGGDQSRRARSE
jgi:hypothetical protein